jgi:hypothetical protein
MIDCVYDTKTSKIVLKNTNCNTDYLVVLVKMETCGACKVYLPEWQKLTQLDNLKKNYTFMILERNLPDNNNLINKLSNLGKEYYKKRRNNPIIEHFPTILIFKKNKNNEYNFYEKFLYQKNLLPIYLNNLQ